MYSIVYSEIVRNTKFTIYPYIKTFIKPDGSLQLDSLTSNLMRQELHFCMIKIQNLATHLGDIVLEKISQFLYKISCVVEFLMALFVKPLQI